MKKMADYALVTKNAIEESSLKKGSLSLKKGYALKSAAMFLRRIRNSKKLLMMFFHSLTSLSWSGQNTYHLQR